MSTLYCPAFLSSIRDVIATLTNYLNRIDVRKLIDRFGIWLIIALAAVLRLWNLGYPSKLVFDETYYVKDAWTLWHNGAEKAWPADANIAFESGSVNTYLTDPSFVVHPPLGKWIIGFGMWLFGAEHGRRTRNYGDLNLGFHGRAHQQEARVADGWHASVADHKNRLVLCDFKNLL